MPLGLRVKPEVEVSYTKFASSVANQVSAAIGQRHLTLIDHKGNYQLTTVDREAIKTTTAQIIQESMGDLNPRGVEARRMIEMTPPLLDAVIMSPYIDAINKDYLLDLVRWGLEGARNPELITRTAIRVGFGGSQDEALPIRHPAYYLPAIDLWNKLKAVRESRIIRVNELRVNHPQESYNDKDLGVFDMPKIEFFFVPNAAIAINGMDPEKVYKQTQSSFKLIRAFMDRFYPDAFASTQFRIDNPSAQYGTFSKIMMDYLVNVIDRYDGEDLGTLMQLLGKLGNNHGKENGHLLAGHYAVIHPVVFQDLLALPPMDSIISEDGQSWANITIGGRPERLFNRIRELLSEHAMPEDFLQYVCENAHNHTDDKQRQETIIKMASWWVGALRQRQEKYKTQPHPHWARADLPLITVPIITSIGTHPVYYLTPYDTVLTAENIKSLRKNGAIPAPEPSSPAERNRKTSVQNDFAKLVSHIGVDKLLDFYEDYTR